MSPAEEKFIKQWQKNSAMGRTKFTLGTVVVAIITALIMEGSHVFIFSGSFTAKSLIQRIVIMSILGFFWGRWYWGSNEKKYQELVKRTSEGD